MEEIGSRDVAWTLRLLRFVQGQLMVLVCLEMLVRCENEDANLGLGIDLVKCHFLTVRHRKTRSLIFGAFSRNAD